VAILQREPGFEPLVAALKRTQMAVASPLAVFEATLAIRRILGCSTSAAERVVVEFVAAARVEVVALAADSAHGALAAFERFGKGTGHAAKLNLGDCFVYGQAVYLGASLLYLGQDFTRTDVRSAATD
jgi:ribonuclease VapC